MTCVGRRARSSRARARRWSLRSASCGILIRGLTANIYSRVDLGDLRDGINRIALPRDGLAGGRTPSHSATLQGLVAPVSPEAQSPKGEGRDQLENVQGNRGPSLVGETGFEDVKLQLPKSATAHPFSSQAADCR
jgi:hypothetical protein